MVLRDLRIPQHLVFWNGNRHFIYDVYYDGCICINNKVLTYRTTFSWHVPRWKLSLRRIAEAHRWKLLRSARHAVSTPMAYLNKLGSVNGVRKVLSHINSNRHIWKTYMEICETSVRYWEWRIYTHRKNKKSFGEQLTPKDSLFSPPSYIFSPKMNCCSLFYYFPATTNSICHELLISTEL